MRALRLLVNWVVLVSSPLWIWAVYGYHVWETRKRADTRRILAGRSWIWQEF